MRSRPAAIVAALFLAQIAVTFEAAMLFAALPTLIRDFGNPMMAGWLVTVHALVGAAAAIVAGRLGDMKGRRRVTLVLLAVATAGSIISALTSSFALVLVGRALQGASIAVLPLSIGILRESLPAERIPVAVGLMTTAQGMGVAVGLVLGGVIVDHINWHALFVASAILLGSSWVAARFIIPDRAGIPPRGQVDWVEGVLPVPGILSLLLGVALSKAAGWADPRVWSLVVVGLAVLAYWVRLSLRSREPFIDLRLLARRNIALANGILVLAALGSTNLVFVFSSYAQSPSWTMVGLGLSATVAGLAKLPSNVLSFVAGPLSGWLTQKFGHRTPILSGGALAALGWFGGMSLPGSLMELIGLLCVISFGTTLISTAIPNIIVAAAPESRTSEAIGTMSVVLGLASATGTQLVATLLTTHTVASPETGASYPSAAGYLLTMGWIGTTTILAALGALLLNERNPETMTESGQPEKAGQARNSASG